MRCTPDVGIGGVGLLLGSAVGKVTSKEPFAHLVTTTEFIDEVSIKPRLVNAQGRVCHQTVTVEALNVIALVGGSVTPNVHAVFVHRTNQHGAGDSTTQRGGVEVGLARGANVESTTLQSNEAFLNEGSTAVNQPSNLSTVFEGAARNAVDVWFICLAEVGGVGARDSTLFAHPRNSNRGVETSREGDTNALTNRQRRKNLRHVSILLSALGS